MAVQKTSGKGKSNGEAQVESGKMESGKRVPRIVPALGLFQQHAGLQSRSAAKSWQSGDEAAVRREVGDTVAKSSVFLQNNRRCGGEKQSTDYPQR